MADAENPRTARAPAPKPFARLSARAWQDIRRARKLGADGQGGGIALHGVKIFFSSRSVAQHDATLPGQDGQQGGTRRDDPQRRQRRADCPPAPDAKPQRSARKQRQHTRLLTWQKAVRFNIALTFKRWAEAARAQQAKSMEDDRAQTQGSEPSEGAQVQAATLPALTAPSAGTLVAWTPTSQTPVKRRRMLEAGMAATMEGGDPVPPPTECGGADAGAGHAGS